MSICKFCGKEFQFHSDLIEHLPICDVRIRTLNESNDYPIIKNKDYDTTFEEPDLPIEEDDAEILLSKDENERLEPFTKSEEEKE
jgi:hypothetical protein